MPLTPLSSDVMDTIVAGQHGDPFAVLGPHPGGAGTVGVRFSSGSAAPSTCAPTSARRASAAVSTLAVSAATASRRRCGYTASAARSAQSMAALAAADSTRT